MASTNPISTAAPGGSTPTYNPVMLDCSKATSNVWLVKVPKYLANKWNEAPENCHVGKIIITATKGLGPKPKQEVVFQLNESLGQTVNIKVNETKSIEEKIPFEHKFAMTPIENQNVYILNQTTDNLKESLSLIGKVTQRAECTPVQNDTNYINLKREANKKFTEPIRQIKIADDIYQRSKLQPKPSYPIDKNKSKRMRDEKEKVFDSLFQAFTKHQYYNIKDLEIITKQPPNYLKSILHEICSFNAKGLHKNTWELKDEYKQNNAKLINKAISDSKNNVENMDDDDDDEFEDMDDDDDEDEEQM